MGCAMLRDDGLGSWSQEAPRILMQAHDRPSFAMRSPCASWSFCVRPRREADPLTTADLDEERRRRKAWRGDLGAFLQNFIAEPPTEGGAPDGPVRAPEHPKPALHFADDGEANFSPRSRNATFYWRGMPGVLQMNYYSEFAQFIVTLSPSFTPARLAPGAARPADAAEPSATRGKLELAFETLAVARFADNAYQLPRRGGEDEESFDRKEFHALVEAAATVAYDEVWAELVGDLRGRRIKAGGSVEGGLFATAEIFAEFALVAVGPVAPSAEEESDDGEIAKERVVERGLKPERMARFLERRAHALDAIFVDGPDREFVAHGAERSRHIYVTTLNSTLRTRLECRDTPKALDSLSGAACAPRGLIYFVGTPPERHFAGLQSADGGPNAHQLGRLLERLQSIEMFRAAALLDFVEVDRAANGLRRIGARLDAIPENVAAKREGEALKAALGALKHIDGGPSPESGTRGGVAYRVSRSALYARSMERRLAELKIKPIPSWQPLAEYLNRRLRDRLDQIAEIGDRRDRLLRRLTLLIDRLQWDELNEIQRDNAHTQDELTNIQRDNARTQQDMATQAIVNTAVAFAALGLTVGGLVDTRPAVSTLIESVLATNVPFVGELVEQLASAADDKGRNPVGGTVLLFIMYLVFILLRWVAERAAQMVEDTDGARSGWRKAFGSVLRHVVPALGIFALVASAVIPAE